MTSIVNDGHLCHYYHHHHYHHLNHYHQHLIVVVTIIITRSVNVVIVAVIIIIGKWFEPRSLSCLCGLIVRVRVVSRRTVVGDIDHESCQSRHDSDDDFRSGCRKVGQCHQQQ